uniref:C2H2-type domain-containing protein n=1 Tax=Leersia perrieri TaxID=77586 RepID=A0A0D9WSP7_9ORYZ
MEFGFRAGDRRPRLPSSASRRGRFVGARGAAVGPFRGGPRRPPPAAAFGWEEAARLERVIDEEVGRRLMEMEVERRLIAEGMRRELEFSHGLHSVFPHDPFSGPPPPPPLLPEMPPMGLHPHPPQPLFEEFGHWEGGFRPRGRHGGVAPAPFRFRQRTLLGGAGRRSPPRPKPKHKLELREIETGESSAEISGIKRKIDAIPSTTGPRKAQKPAQDWSCALCQVSATSEAALNEHLEGKKHKAKLVHCGVSNIIKDGKSSLKETTTNKDDAGPNDAPKKVCILVDGAMHEVVQRSNYLWCDRCKVRCDNNVTMSDHLRGKKHSGLNKVWTSINAVRMNMKKEISASTCEETVNENEPTEIPVEIKDESTGMPAEADESSHVKIHLEKVKAESTDMSTEVDQSDPVENETPGEIMEEGMNISTDENVQHEHTLEACCRVAVSNFLVLLYIRPDIQVFLLRGK